MSIEYELAKIYFGVNCEELFDENTNQLINLLAAREDDEDEAKKKYRLLFYFEQQEHDNDNEVYQRTRNESVKRNKKTF